MAGTDQRMFAIPPDGKASPEPETPRVHVNWLEYFLLQIVSEDLRARYLLRAFRRNIKRAVRDPNAKCPACGACSGEIRWAESFSWPDGKRGALLHGCKVCKAAWGERPIVAFEDWKITLSPVESRELFEDVRKSA